jgi:hypothetical protein
MPEGMHTISAWAIVHKDQITLLAAIVSALTAIVVAFLTFTLAIENRRLRKAGTEPEVVAYLLPDQRHLNLLNLVVANVGRGPARNVELEFIGDHLDILRKRGARLLTRSKLPILAVLPQDERFVQLFGSYLEFFSGDPAPPDFTIRVNFENSSGSTKSTKSRVSISDFDGVTRNTSPEHEAVEALKQIAKSVQGWGGFNRLKVETITAAEVAREQKAQYDAAMEQIKQRDDPDIG